MAKFQGWKKRYAYLDDYKPGIDGKYVYYGRHQILKGGRTDWKNYRWLMGTASAVLLALLVITGFIEAGAYWRQWYTNLTYALKAIAAFLVIWKTLTLITEKYPVKQYLYAKSVPWYRPCAVITIITGVLAAAAALVCIIINPEGTLISGCVIETVLNLLTAAAGVVMYIMLGKYEWEEDPSEEVQ